MADMSDIPSGIARKIAVEHLDNLDDVESFSQVCSSWRFATRDVNYTNFCPSKNTQLPWLLLADSSTSSYRRFYNLSTRMVLKINLPQFEYDLGLDLDHDHRKFFSSKGWLISVTRKQALISFFDPFSATLIKPPSIPLLSLLRDGDRWNDEDYLYCFSKFVFSNSARPWPSSTDFQVAMIYHKKKHIAFWRPGQQQWIKPNMDIYVRKIHDVCFFKGEFYSIDKYSQVIAFGSEVPNRSPRIAADLKPLGFALGITEQYYILVFNQNESTLLIVRRGMDWYGFTKSFRLIEFNVDDGKTKLVHDIGNRALFVGLNSTFFVDAEDEASPSHSDQRKRGCRPNSIYFTEEDVLDYECGKDMGIFCCCLKEGRSELVYEGPYQYIDVTPPIWVELPHN